jgi:hypothetical protein
MGSGVGRAFTSRAIAEALPNEKGSRCREPRDLDSASSSAEASDVRGPSSRGNRRAQNDSTVLSGVRGAVNVREANVRVPRERQLVRSRRAPHACRARVERPITPPPNVGTRRSLGHLHAPRPVEPACAAIARHTHDRRPHLLPRRSSP